MFTLNLARAAHAPAAATVHAGAHDDAPLAAAAGAGGDVHELPEDALLGTPDLACAVALGADLGLAPGRGPGAAAVVAVLEARVLELLLGAEGRLFELQPHARTEVGTAAWTAPPAPAARTPAEEGVEDIAEAVERREAVEACGPGASVDARMTETVVGAAFLGVGEHLVSAVDLLEAFGRIVPGIAVGVVLHRQLAIRPFEVVVRGASVDAEHFVEVSLA